MSASRSPCAHRSAHAASSTSRPGGKPSRGARAAARRRAWASSDSARERVSSAPPLRRGLGAKATTTIEVERGVEPGQLSAPLRQLGEGRQRGVVAPLGRLAIGADLPEPQLDPLDLGFDLRRPLHGHALVLAQRFVARGERRSGRTTPLVAADDLPEQIGQPPGLSVAPRLPPGPVRGQRRPQEIRLANTGQQFAGAVASATGEKPRRDVGAGGVAHRELATGVREIAFDGEEAVASLQQQRQPVGATAPRLPGLEIGEAVLAATIPLQPVKSGAQRRGQRALAGGVRLDDERAVAEPVLARPQTSEAAHVQRKESHAPPPPFVSGIVGNASPAAALQAGPATSGSHRRRMRPVSRASMP